MPNSTPQKEWQCPICANFKGDYLGTHIRDDHGPEKLKIAILAAKEEGIPDPVIGAVYGITFKQLEEMITDEYGVNISSLKSIKKVKIWGPKHFKEESTTVWSFKQRGNWATHDGRYRGNWSPFIPRNVILKYSEPGDVVLDYFSGGGTTAVEAKLLGRRCIARDINKASINLTKENLDFTTYPNIEEPQHHIYEPVISMGDARDLSNINNDSVDLICAHPPYAGIIKYSSKVEGDLSKFSTEEFYKEIRKTADESYRILKPGKKCAILIGDTRKEKHIIPIGFNTIKVFLDAGFKLSELVIKRQHNCKTTGFWYSRSIQHNFLLLAHEYLPIFKKPISNEVKEVEVDYSTHPDFHSDKRLVPTYDETDQETTTVWILPKENLKEELQRNVLTRFAVNDMSYVQFSQGTEETPYGTESPTSSLVYVDPPTNQGAFNLNNYLNDISSIVERSADILDTDRYLIIDTLDIRNDSNIIPLGLHLVVNLTDNKNFKLKEIIFVIPNGIPSNPDLEKLKIIHRYLLVYRRV